MSHRRWRFGRGCEDCGGTGAQFDRELSCDGDFCVGAGGFLDCHGHWAPCSGCMRPPRTLAQRRWVRLHRTPLDVFYDLRRGEVGDVPF